MGKKARMVKKLLSPSSKSKKATMTAPTEPSDLSPPVGVAPSSTTPPRIKRKASFRSSLCDKMSGGKKKKNGARELSSTDLTSDMSTEQAVKVKKSRKAREPAPATGERVTRSCSGATALGSTAAASAVAAPKIVLRDPISLEELGKWTFSFEYAQGAVVYNCDSICNYLLATGDFRCPMTRVPFTFCQVVELVRVASKASLKLDRSLIEAWNARNDPSSRFKQEKERREMLSGSDRCLGDIVTEMLHAIEHPDSDEGQIRLVVLYPQFTHLFNELKAADPAFARQCLDHYARALRGPPLRPTKDPLGLLRTTLDFMQSCMPNTAYLASFYTPGTGLEDDDYHNEESQKKH